MMRFPPRRILAAVDLTAASRPAWAAARRVAARFGSELEAVYCEGGLPPEMDVYGWSRPDAQRRRRTKSLLLRRLGLGARVRVAAGDPARVLPRLAREGRFDLIVMGTHRRRGARRLAFGSVAEAVSRASRCPVLVVPGPMRDIRSVLAPVHEAGYARRGLLAAGVVARAYGARLDVLNVSSDPVFDPDPRRLLAARVGGLPASIRSRARTLARVDEPVPGILRSERGHDLVVLSSHAKASLGDWLLGSTAQRVIRRSPVPVLTVPV